MMFCLILCSLLLLLEIDITQGSLIHLPEGITLHRGSVTWHEAREICQRKGAVLASPIDDKSLSAMKSVIGTYDTMYFIGTKATNLPGEFVSIDGIALEDMAPAVTLDMSQQLNQQDGDCLAMTRNNIRTVSCWISLPYMCYDTKVYNINRTQCGPSQEGYKYEKSIGRCYKLHIEKRLTWDEAHWTCASEGGYLAIVENQKEAAFFTNMYNFNQDFHIFIGRRKVIGTDKWRSIHGQPMEDLFNVVTGTRTPTNSEFNCGGLHHSGSWQYVRCSAVAHFFCIKEPKTA